MTEVKTGGIQMVSVDGRYRVWTKRRGSGPIRMLTLHGGPGCTHEYFECFEDFLPQRGLEFFYYDQLGSAYSDQPDDPGLWTVERFREEVEQVRAALGLEDFYLYGHSWGGLLAIEYALEYQQHLKGLIVSNMVASIPSYVSSITELRRQLPREVLEVLEKYEAAGDYDAPEYTEILFEHVYSKHICRVSPWPEPLLRMFRHMNGQVYNTMQGPNEFVVTGNFKDLDRWHDLHRITVPTLLLGARFDTMCQTDIERMGQLMPASRVSICDQGSHCAMYDDQEAYFRHLLQFVSDVEAGAFEERSGNMSGP